MILSTDTVKNNPRRLSFVEFIAYVRLQRELYGTTYAKRLLTKYLPLYYNVDNQCILYGHHKE